MIMNICILNSNLKPYVLRTVNLNFVFNQTMYMTFILNELINLLLILGVYLLFVL